MSALDTGPLRDRLYQAAKRLQRRWYLADYEDLRLREKWLRGDPTAPFEERVFPVRPDPASLRSVLVFKPDEIGDAVYALPAIAELRRHAPEARVSLVCRGLTKPFYERSGLLDAIAVFEPGSRLRPSPLLHQSLATLPDARFDVAIFLRTHQAGFRRFLSIPADAHVHPLDPRMRSTSPYQAPISRWGDVRTHQVLQHLQIVSLLTGRTYSFADVEFPSLHWADDDVRGPELVFGDDVPPSYLVVHPFAKEETRRYPPDYWPELLRILVDELDVPVVIVGGPEDPSLAERPGLLQTQGRLTLMQTAYLISSASGFVGNLSGPAHLSGALGSPTVTLMGGNSLPVEWAPLGDSLVVRADVPCSPCHRTHCPGYGLACLRALTPERIAPHVLGFLRERLTSRAPAAASPRRV